MNGGIGDTTLNNITLDYFVREIDPYYFNVEVMDQVFSCFINSLGETPGYNADDFKDIKVGEKLRQPVIFSYENNEWQGKLAWAKWKNNEDKGNIWNTFSIKLPNDYFIYEKSYRVSDPPKSVSGTNLTHALKYAIEFFDDDDASLVVFFSIQKYKLNIKVKSDKYKALLQVTYEYGFPDMYNSENGRWYTIQQMKQLLSQNK